MLTSFSSHLHVAHAYWKNLLQEGQWVIDATCGNGHDTVFLAQQVIGSSGTGGVIALDIQEQALENTRQRLKNHLTEQQGLRVTLFQQSHSQFPLVAYAHPIQMVVYNLGYLPGGNKNLTTKTEETLLSLKCALDLIVPGGLISITCYPGHEEGAREENALLHFSQSLELKKYVVTHQRWVNRKAAPSLLMIQKKHPELPSL